MPILKYLVNQFQVGGIKLIWTQVWSTKVNPSQINTKLTAGHSGHNMCT